jgi:5,5'-dehydrodivanillate O-demethylase
MARWTYTCEQTGPGTLAGRYMRLFWQPVQRLVDIARGRAKPLRIMGENLTLYRGASGRPYVVAYRCAHRGVQLSVGAVEGEEIRCGYHGWKYTGSGACVERPAEGAGPVPANIKIRGYPVREYHGLVFAYLGEGEPPEFPIFPELEGEGVHEATVYRRDCNITQFIDNQLDEAHVVFTHPVAFARIPEIPDIRIERTEFTAVSHCTRPGRGVRVTEFLVPNITRLKVPTPFLGLDWADGVVWRVPIDDSKVLAYGINRFTGSEPALANFVREEERLRSLRQPPMNDFAKRVLAGETTVAEVEQSLGERHHLHDLQLEDHVMMEGQGVVADRSQEILGRSDVGVIAVRDLWDEQLRAFASHGERRVWVQPPPTAMTTGEAPIAAE